VAGIVSFIGGVLLHYIFQYLTLVTIFASIIFLIFLLKKKRPVLILFLLAGFIYSFVRYVPPEEYRKEGFAVLRCITSPPLYSDDNEFQVSQVLHVKGGRFESGEPVRKETLKSYSEMPLKQGITYEVAALIREPQTGMNPGAPRERRAQAEILKILSAGPAGPVESMRARLNAYFIQSFPPDSAGFLMAVTTGERALLDEKLWDIFNRAGIGHLLSISGTHFAVFSFAIFTAARFFFKLLPVRALNRATLYITPSQAGAILTLPLISAYLLLSGGDVPALRSFFMIALFLVGLLIGRKRAWLNALALAALVLVLWDPGVLFDISFQMSFIAVLFIGMFTDREWKKENTLKKYFKGTIAVTLSATLGLLPLIALYFHRASLISPVANLVSVPLAGFLLIPIAVFSSFAYLLSGVYIFPWLTGFLARLAIKTAGLFSSIPFASVGVPAFPVALLVFFYVMAAFYFFKRREKKVLVLAALPFFIWLGFSALKGDAPSITLLDTGDAESSVMELPDGKVLVIDCGKTGREAASYLRYRGIGTIDALVLTHPHSDHTGGAARLLSDFRVKEIWDNGRLSYEGTVFGGIPRKTLSRGDFIEGRGYKLLVLHPYTEYFNVRGQEYIEENDSSLVLKIEGAKGLSALLAGDVELEAEEDLAELGPLLKSDILKVPHHGSRYSAYEPFLEAVSPSVALISVGGGNQFGHPHEETLDALEALDGAKVFRTDRDGAIRVELGKKPFVKTFRDFRLKRRPGIKEEVRNLRVLFSTF